LVYVRDTISCDLARSLSLDADKLKYCPDLAFDLPALDRRSASAYLTRYGYDEQRASAGATVISRLARSLDPDSLANYESVLTRSLAQLVERYGVAVYFFPQGTGPTPQEDDRLAARRVVERQPAAQASMTAVEEPLPPATLKGLYGLMDIFVATRLHSGIFALSAGVPTLFVGYLTKTRGMLTSLGLGEEFLVELASLDAADFWARLENLWLRRHAVRERLLGMMPAIAAQTRQLGYEIAEDFFRHAG
jgi:colanic acid/amylovoran biosynthesis protein